MNDTRKTKAQLIEELNQLRAHAARQSDTIADLQRLRDLNAHIFTAMAEGVIVEDVRGYFTSINPRAAQLLGYAPTDLIGRHWTAIMPPDQWPIVEAANQRRARGETDQYELELLHCDGRRIRVWVAGRPLIDPMDGRPIGRLAEFTEMAGRVHAEDTLRSSEALYRAMFEKNQATKLLIDPATGAIVDANLAASRFYGYSRAVLQTMQITDINTLPRAALWVQMQLAQSEQQSLFLFKHRLASGEVRDVEVHASPLEVGGRSLLFSIVHDVTDRLRAEAALEQSRARLKAIFDNAAIAICLVDYTGRYIQFNQRWAELLGRTPDEIYQLHNVDVTHPDDRAISHARLLELVSGAVDHYELDKRYVRADGSVFWGALSATAIRRETGEFEASIGLVTDITERKQAEAALRASEVRYQQLVELSPDGIAVHRNGRLIYVNSAGVRLAGAASPNELLGRSMLDLVHPDYREMALARIRHSLQHHISMPLMEEKFLRLDGSSFDVEVMSLPFEQDGQWSVQVIVRDVTERKRSEAEQKAAHLRLAQHNQLLAQILETGNQLRITLDLPALLQQIVEAVRRGLGFGAVTVMIRQGDSERVGPRVQTGLPPQIAAQLDQADTRWSDLARLMQPKFLINGCYFIPTGAFDWATEYPAPAFNVIDYDATDVTDPDRWLPDDALLVPIELREGRFIGVLTLDAPHDGRRPSAETLQALRIFANLAAAAIENAQLHDEVRQHAQNLEQHVADRTRALTEAYEQLQELDRMKDRFVSLVSHELRTPLANIKLYLGLLERGKPERQADYRLTLQQETARLNQLIEDLLDISRLDTGQTAVNLVADDLDRLVQALLPGWRAQAAARQLTLYFDPGDSLPAAWLDPVLLNKALSNLMMNALNYTPDHGVIRCALALGVDGGQSWVTLTIRDNGPGIEPHEQLRIFERFYRGRAARNYKVPGTGLGLAICKEIVTRLGGRITVESWPEQGSAFCVWLRVAAKS